MSARLRSQAGAGQSADARREWANAVLEALRTQSKLPGQDGLPQPSPEKGPPAQIPDNSSPSGAPNPSASSSAGAHAAPQPGMSTSSPACIAAGIALYLAL